MLQRNSLTIGFVLILLPFTLWGQILDDSWQNDVQIPGFPRSIKDIGIDSRGVIIVRADNTTPDDISPYFFHDTNGWHHIPLPLDTVLVGANSAIINDRYSTALFPNGEILAESRMVVTGDRNTLRFDRVSRQWRHLLPVTMTSVVYGQDGRFYSTVRDTSTGRLVVLRTEGGLVDTVTADIPPDLRLLGASARSTLFLADSWDSIYSFQNGRLEVTSIEQPVYPGGEAQAYSVGKTSFFFTRTFYSIDSTTSEFHYQSVIHRVSPGSPVQTILLPEDNAITTMGEEENFSAGSIVERNDGTLFVATRKGLLHWDGEEWSRMDTSYASDKILETPTGDVLAFRSRGIARTVDAGSNFAIYQPEEDSWSFFHHPDDTFHVLVSPGEFTEIGDDYVRIGDGTATRGNDLVSGGIIEFREGEWNVVLESTDLPDFRIIEKISDGADGCYIAELLPQSGLDRRRSVRVYHQTADTFRLIGDSTLFPEQYIDLLVHRDTLYAIAMYHDTNSYLRSRVVRFAGDDWTILHDSNHVNSPELLSDGRDIYVGGHIYSIHHDSNGIALFRQGQMMPLGKGVWSNSSLGPVVALARDGDDIFVGGSFKRAGDSISHGVARWDGSRWHSLEAGLFDPDRERYGPGGVVRSIAATNSVVAVVGEFTSAGDPDPLSPMHVDLGYGAAFWDRSRQSWNNLGTAFADPVLTGSHGRPLRVNAVGNTLWFTGYFGFAGGKPAGSLTRFVVPPAHISPPEAPAVLDFGFVLPRDTGMAWLPVLNPSTSTRTMRGDLDGFDSPFSIDFDGRFQSASGQLKFLPIRVIPDRNGVILDTVTLSYDDSPDDHIPVILRVRSSILSVDEHAEPTGGLDLSIEPNPIDREGRITVRAPEGGVVKVSVYRLDGRKVTDLFQGEISGERSLLWHAGDLPSGVYLCRLSGRGEEISRTIILR